jgi:pyruvate,water dikinase
MADVQPGPMMAGFREGTRRYGVLLDYLDIAVINRFLYVAPRAVGAPKSAQGHPPRLIFALLRRFHPEIRRRVKRADEVFRTKFWRQDLEWWDREVKPGMQAQAHALLAEDLSALSDVQLADHVRRAAAFLRSAIFNHHRFNVCTMITLGDFLIHAMDWTGMPAGELLQTMRGLSPVSAGAIEELTQLRRAILADASALELVTSSRQDADILSQLQARTDAVGVAARAYVDVVGLRVIGGYDVADRHAREHPQMIVKIIRAAVAADDTARRAAAEQALAHVRARVPEEHRQHFEALLGEAQHTYRLRDERVFYGDALAVGVARRAILAAGERLVRRQQAESADDLVDASPAEIIALLEGKRGPSAQELAARARWRRETPLSAAPATLGFPPSPPPPAEWLPPSAARMHRIVGLVMQLLFDVHRSDAPSKQLKGFAVSPGVYEGPVRLIRDVDELPSVQRGEVLVTTSTGPTFNVVLPLIGALVTERGGVLSHAAIVSREYGLPGVVGCVGATSALRTGMRVRVDGDKGEVWTLS